MPKWARANSCTLPAAYLTARSRLCSFRTNRPLKHANMSVSRTAARSPLNTLQPDHIYAGFEQTCQNEHEQNSCTLPALTARSRRCSFRADMPLKHANMGVSRQLHTPRPDSQITCTAVCRGWVTKYNRITHNGYTNWSSKTESRRPSGKTTILRHSLKENLKGKSSAPKWRKTRCQSTSRDFLATTTTRFRSGTCKPQSE